MLTDYCNSCIRVGFIGYCSGRGRYNGPIYGRIFLAWLEGRQVTLGNHLIVRQRLLFRSIFLSVHKFCELGFPSFLG